jgi:hypothetical protein
VADNDETDPLAAIVKALKPLKSEDRLRTVRAAMLYLDETWNAEHRSGPVSPDQPAATGGYSQKGNKWVKDNEISGEALERVFHFNDDGSFEVVSVPGRSKRDKAQNAYILTGVGALLTTGNPSFADASARGFCEQRGCYDSPNHAGTIKKCDGLIGGKKKGYTVTSVGLKTGAELVKQLAAGSK